MIIYPVLMVGGAGTRLWPVSRKAKPKQFQNLIDPDQSLFQETATRMGREAGSIKIGAPVVIGGADYLGLIEDQLREVGIEPAAIVLEPEPKNTAAVAGVAARIVGQLPGDSLCLLMPSDHHVPDADAFRSAVANGAMAAKHGSIVTFGITMTRPESGFGHIEPGEQIDDFARKVASFIEKPQPPLDQELFDGGRHAWNAGIFLFSPDSMATEMEAHCPEILRVVDASLPNELPGDGIVRLDPSVFSTCPSEPVDVAVMQETSRAAMVGPVACGWSDIGGWLALADMATPGTISPNVLALDSDKSYIRSDGSVLITGVGLDDMIVVAHEGSVLVIPKARAQEVKRIIGELKNRDMDDKL
ncbi:MAG: sugar phosphate nucleotidyltransferase [Pseudomonadota bacterium]